MTLVDFPLENQEEWEGILQSGESQRILNRLEKLEKITQNTGKVMQFWANVIYYFLPIFKRIVYYLLKWIKFSVFKKKQTKHLKNIGK